MRCWCGQVGCARWEKVGKVGKVGRGEPVLGPELSGEEAAFCLLGHDCLYTLEQNTL